MSRESGAAPSERSGKPPPGLQGLPDLVYQSPLESLLFDDNTFSVENTFVCVRDDPSLSGKNATRPFESAPALTFNIHDLPSWVQQTPAIDEEDETTSGPTSSAVTQPPSAPGAPGGLGPQQGPPEERQDGEDAASRGAAGSVAAAAAQPGDAQPAYVIKQPSGLPSIVYASGLGGLDHLLDQDVPIEAGDKDMPIEDGKSNPIQTKNGFIHLDEPKSMYARPAAEPPASAPPRMMAPPPGLEDLAKDGPTEARPEALAARGLPFEERTPTAGPLAISALLDDCSDITAIPTPPASQYYQALARATAGPACPSAATEAAPPRAQLSLASVVAEPEIGSLACPTVGSKDHWSGNCRPCAHAWDAKRPCTNGKDCDFCHLCPKGELKRRQKEGRNRRLPMGPGLDPSLQYMALAMQNWQRHGH